MCNESIYAKRKAFCSKPTAYTIINDLTEVADHLPRMCTSDMTAILRHKGETKEEDYRFRPFRVKQALLWLEKKNHLYEHIILELEVISIGY